MYILAKNFKENNLIFIYCFDFTQKFLAYSIKNCQPSVSLIGAAKLRGGISIGIRGSHISGFLFKFIIRIHALWNCCISSISYLLRIRLWFYPSITYIRCITFINMHRNVHLASRSSYPVI